MYVDSLYHPIEMVRSSFYSDTLTPKHRVSVSHVELRWCISQYVVKLQVLFISNMCATTTTHLFQT